MLKLLKHIWLGVALIVAASSLLLISDMDRRQTGGVRPARKQLPRLAVFQWVSTDLLDHTVEGIVEGLRRQGFEHGRTADIRFFNASGDNATGNALARELVGGTYDMVLTASTLALQAVAQANAQGRVPHVFGGVTDPYGAGVGITGPAPDQHPPHLTGVGTFQPVERAIQIACRMNPGLRRIGVVWNPGESNSEACVIKARAMCAELGIELIEANAGAAPEVPEAVRSILARRAESIWVGGDTVAISAISAIVSAARAERTPVFSNDPSDLARGVLFSVGASYRDVGIAVGDIGGKILNGASPASFGVRNLVPERWAVNEDLAGELEGWSVPEDLRGQPAPSARAPQPGRVYRVGVFYFGPNPVLDMGVEGVLESLREAGFVEGENLVVRRAHPNGDMSLLPQIAGQLASQELDLVIPLTTPCLGAALARIKTIPLVFGIVSAPIEAGAGTSFTDHLPNVTGAVWTAPNPALFEWLRRLVPDCRSVGVVYNPSEANSRLEIEAARAMLDAHGMRLVATTVNTSSEVIQAAQALLGSGVDAVFAMADNTVASAFTAMVQTFGQARIPVLADDASMMGTGALFTVGASPRGEGRQAGRLAARVLLGESPAAIPFMSSSETETAVDLGAAASLGITLPVGLLKDADVFYNATARIGRPYRIAVINLDRSLLLDAAEQGVLRGLMESGFLENRDFTVERHCAQGDVNRLPELFAAARAAPADLMVAVSTPALRTAVRDETEIPIVFVVAEDPAAPGLFTAETRPVHITGVRLDPAVDHPAARIEAHEAGGARAGRLAARILSGVPPRELPVESIRARTVIDSGGAPAIAQSPAPNEAPARPWEIRVIRFNDAQFSADTHRGIMDGFNRAGLREGVDFHVRCLNAQGDMTTLASIMTAVRAERPDLVMPISTPALQAALRQAGPLPMVFCSVGDGVRAGAGTSEADHLPNVTGITTRSPFEGMARLIRESVPRVRAVGTLFSPAEINSELYREWFAEALKDEGLELVSVPVTTSADIAEATTALLRSDIQLVAQISDNTTRPGFAQIVRRSRDAGIPFFSFDSAGMSDGATLSLARDYYENGVEAAGVAVRVLRGESPGGIPFTNTRTETLTIHPDRLKDYTITLSPDLLRRARVEPRPVP